MIAKAIHHSQCMYKQWTLGQMGKEDEEAWKYPYTVRKRPSIYVPKEYFLITEAAPFAKLSKE